MSEHREHREIDPRVHAILDGELSPSETAAFEGDLRSGNAAGNHLKTLKHLGAWFRATRSRAPSNLFRSVERTLENERALAARTRASHQGKPFDLRLALRWAWIPATAAMALLIVLSVIPPRRVTGPSDGGPQPSERAVNTDPQTSGTPAPGDSGENRVRYVFTLEAVDAKEVCLAGDFNQWRVCEAPLQRVEGDTWTIAVDLPRGRHEYMFVIDGRWVTDPNAMGHVKDGFGNKNAVVVV